MLLVKTHMQIIQVPTLLFRKISRTFPRLSSTPKHFPGLSHTPATCKYRDKHLATMQKVNIIQRQNTRMYYAVEMCGE